MKYFIFIIILLSSHFCSAEQAGHWGVGIGSNYGGPGVKYSQGISENIEVYANLGLPTLFSLVSYRTGGVASFGSEYAFTNNQHHTLNIAYAYLRHKNDDAWDTEQKKYQENITNLSGAVLGYTYYFSGLKSKGQALGFSFIHLTEKKTITPMEAVGNEDLKSISISWGYRF